MLLVTLLFLVVPSFVFAALESHWGLLDAFYYCFISLTTIGLGDYIPGDGLAQPQYRTLYQIGTTVYLIVGLVAMMWILTIFYEIPQLNLGQMFTAYSSLNNAADGADDDDAGLANAVPGTRKQTEKSQFLKSETPQRCYSTSSGINKLSGIFGGGSGQAARNQEVQRSVVKIRPHHTDDEDDDYSPAEPMRAAVP